MSNDEYPSKSGWPLYLWIASGLVPALVMTLLPLVFLGQYMGSDSPAMGIFLLSSLACLPLGCVYLFVWGVRFHARLNLKAGVKVGIVAMMCVVNFFLGYAGCLIIGQAAGW